MLRKWPIVDKYRTHVCMYEWMRTLYIEFGLFNTELLNDPASSVLIYVTCSASIVSSMDALRISLKLKENVSTVTSCRLVPPRVYDNIVMYHLPQVLVFSQSQRVLCRCV